MSPKTETQNSHVKKKVGQIDLIVLVRNIILYKTQ